MLFDNKGSTSVKPASPGDAVELELMQRYSPACVLINEQHEVIYSPTRTAGYLEQPIGKPTFNILDMVHEGLRPALQAALRKLKSLQQTVSFHNLRILIDGFEQCVNLRVEPFAPADDPGGLILVIFEDVNADMTADGADQPQLIAELEERLRLNQELLEDTVERHHSSGEELKTANEELMAMNEELQSSNEELETSREELQALSEELMTLNAELQSKVQDLGIINDDMQNLLTSSEVATLFLDRQLQVKRFTPLAAKFFNLLERDIGTRFENLSGNIRYPQWSDDAKKVLDRLEPVEKEVVTDKSEYYLIRMLPYKTSTNQIDGIVITLIDLTERRLLEERLFQAEKMQAIGQLAGGVAHDFNNQLSGILGFADMLIIKAKEPDLVRFAQNIKVSARCAADLIQKLLAFGRKGQFLTQPLSIHNVIADVISILKHSIDKNIRIQQALDADSDIVSGDVSQLHAAFLNIALNARDAMPDGGEMTFYSRIVHFDEDFVGRRAEELKAGAYLQLLISDNGIGISSDHLPRVFEPFFTTKQQGSGTGMGLSSAYGTVRQHGGFIDISSEPGVGTTIELHLPLADSILNIPDQQKDATVSRGRGRILLVDDEEIMRAVAGEMLEVLGYQVVLCTNGREAVDYYRDHAEEVDLVILDMIMPVMGGYEAFNAMREINPAILAILASGYSYDGTVQAALDAGVRHFIPKPFELANLSEVLIQLLEQPSQDPSDQLSV